MSKKKAIVLGGTVPHIELIKQLKERGYYIILVDYYDNPIAKPYADEHIQESTLDFEIVYQIAINNKVELVISTSIDQANITACYVMEKMNLYSPFSKDLIERITNKGDMKKTMWKNNIPTSKYVYIEKGDSFNYDSEMTFPLIVKPADANSSKGVKIANTLNEAKEYIEQAADISRNNRVIIEEYITGKEASVYCYISENEVHVLLIAQRISRIDGDEKAIKCYASVSGLDISETMQERIKWSVSAIAKAYKLKCTPFFMQVILQKDDISIIEFAPRTGGGMCFATIKSATGFDYISAAIDSFLGKETKCMPLETKHIVAVNTLYSENGILNRIEGDEKLIKDDVIEGIFPIKTPGMKLIRGTASSERVAFLVLKGKTKEEICEKVKKAIETIDVYDVSGNKILRKDMFLCMEDLL